MKKSKSLIDIGIANCRKENIEKLCKSDDRLMETEVVVQNEDIKNEKTKMPN